jgi:hypothetical protein
MRTFTLLAVAYAYSGFEVARINF